MIDHAASTVPFHRERLRRTSFLESIEGLVDLPICERADLAAVSVADRRAGPPAPRTQYKRTSGATGQYLTVESSPRAAWWQGILELRRNKLRGLEPWVRTAAVRVAPDTRPRRGALGQLSRRSLVLDASDPPGELARRLLDHRPALVSGFGHLLADIGDELDGRLSPRVLGTGGQMLTQHDRAALTARYGVTALDLYGCVEVGTIAWQCPEADLYHVDHDSVVVEVVDADGRGVPPGAPGDIVVTALTNRHMPFIRYRLGDRARLSTRPCRCGHAGPALASIDGRTMDRFVTDSGDLIASSRLFLSAPGTDITSSVGRYRVVQDSRRNVTVEIVPTHPIPGSTVEAIREHYGSILGAGTAVSVRFVDHIGLEPSGKLRQFVSAATTG